eukprot:CAMPEP_0202457284 /NCGR_PEP_ID=MMETSP1360-20130828/14338_1 /ASSEMBLY_ACC=CAM_ASM_000848 /TAXON_ID=515479 /ORGANISM="Licmophora paradoxa, Strain CCMP2313" /LENGTH=403 /DNA_ID=CAMNT_0049077315 /DNA_START=178 /DNA_END=1389 /DNA_ORIENTATION=+
MVSIFDTQNIRLDIGDADIPWNIPEGVYYSKENHFITSILSNWDQQSRTYESTPYLPTGDSRTGIPFLTNFWPDVPFTRVWLPTLDDEAVRLEIAFPQNGHETTKPMYLLLHGLTGGSQEEYVKDFIYRVHKQGCTVVIMIARGLMDTPIKGWSVFHGARVIDAQEAAKVLAKAKAPGQTLAGVGYSMGAIILTNYVARAGPDCPLDVAVSISGTLDSRPQIDNVRAHRLWEPLIAKTLRDVFIVGKLADRYRVRLTKKQMLELMRAHYIGLIDEHAVVTYNGYRDIYDYYGDMSALGDIPVDAPPETSRLANISIPLCQIHALDDPLVTWKTIAANEGPRHPSNLVKIGDGNLVLLLTKGGGHVGWPTGLFPTIDKWSFMNNQVMKFVDAFEQARIQTNVSG